MQTVAYALLAESGRKARACVIWIPAGEEVRDAEGVGEREKRNGGGCIVDYKLEGVSHACYGVRRGQTGRKGGKGDGRRKKKEGGPGAGIGDGKGFDSEGYSNGACCSGARDKGDNEAERCPKR